MDEQTRLLEMIVGQIDKRLGSIEQHLAGFHAAIEHVRDEVAQVRTDLHTEIVGVRTELRGEIGQVRDAMERMRSDLYAEIRSNFRWTITTMVALFAIAVPVWTWFLSLIIKAR